MMHRPSELIARIEEYAPEGFTPQRRDLYEDLKRSLTPKMYAEALFVICEGYRIRDTRDPTYYWTARKRRTAGEKAKKVPFWTERQRVAERFKRCIEELREIRKHPMVHSIESLDGIRIGWYLPWNVRCRHGRFRKGCPDCLLTRTESEHVAIDWAGDNRKRAGRPRGIQDYLLKSLVGYRSLVGDRIRGDGHGGRRLYRFTVKNVAGVLRSGGYTLERSLGLVREILQFCFDQPTMPNSLKRRWLLLRSHAKAEK